MNERGGERAQRQRALPEAVNERWRAVFLKQAACLDEAAKTKKKQIQMKNPEKGARVARETHEKVAVDYSARLVHHRQLKILFRLKPASHVLLECV